MQKRICSFENPTIFKGSKYTCKYPEYNTRWIIETPVLNYGEKVFHVCLSFSVLLTFYNFQLICRKNMQHAYLLAMKRTLSLNDNKLLIWFY